ncbi:prepilin-type N-terminal cleavage/methylation domain-containing protein [uncultured Massilia sp.]|uniref:type IV pilus modification PilV family protein n=1 Tax=uncultured Massilia sp. TaxID=169973 RepID=UPI0025E2284C|nr:prepilin-type N-terminal cleavage/methylation domain-containing protein [uncultured Massilia sp.]
MIARRQRGMALIEALVAAVLLAIGLIGVIGLQARSQGALADAGMRAEAVIAANRLLGTMAVDQANLASYALAATGTPSARLQPWVDETRAHIPGAGMLVTVGAAADGRTRVAVTISWARKSGTAANAHSVVAYLAPAASS